MEQECPNWLTETSLVSALQGENHESPITLVKFTANRSVVVGNNYSSCVYRVQVQYRVGENEEKSSSLIVKGPVTYGIFAEMLGKSGFYDKEPKIYNELIPKMNKKLNCELSPKSYYCQIKNGLVLKDMNEEGYIMCDKRKQLDFSHCKYVFITLAKFHAASVACYHEHPDLIKSVGKEQMYIEHGPFEEMLPFLQLSLKAVGTIFNRMNDGKLYAEFILSRVDNILDSLINICKSKSTGFNVLNHGDFWCNNMLFKHNDCGEIIDVKLIDFQGSRLATPVLDLIYFFCTSANEDVRENKQEELYKIYLETLNNTLEQLGCEERMSAGELKEDLKSSANLGLITACYLFPLIVGETQDAINVENLSKDNLKDLNPGEITQMFNGKHFKALIPNLIKEIQAWTLI